MLPEPALSLIREQSQIQLQGTSEALAALEQGVTGHVSCGFSRSPCCGGKLNRELIAFHDRKVRGVMDAARRVVESVRMAPYDQMANDLVETLLKQMESMEHRVVSRKEPYPGLAHPKDIPRVGDAIRKMHVWLRGECNLLSAMVKAMWEERKSKGSIHVHCEQSGHNSRVNVNSDDRSVNIFGG